MKEVYIFHDFASSKYNGIGTFLKEIIPILQHIGFIVTLIDINSDNGEFQKEQIGNFSRISIPSTLTNGFMDNAICVTSLLSLYIKDEKNAIFLYNQTPCSLLVQAMKERFPLSFHFLVIHDMAWTTYFNGNIKEFEKIFFNSTHPFLKVYKEEKYLYSLFDHVICLSNETERILRKIYHIPPNNISLIPNPAKDTYSFISPTDKTILREKFHLKKKELLFIWIGRFAPIKGLHLMLKSFGVFLEKVPSVRLAIIGQTYNMNNTLNFCKDFSSHIIFTGFLSPEEISRWYQMADVGVITSYSEQCSYTGIEMLMHGLPIIASDGHGMSSMFKGGVNCLTAKIMDIKDETTCINNLVSCMSLMLSKSTRKELGKKARATYLSNYTPDIVEKKYKLTLQKIIR